jgi:hypothetical protein
MRAEFDTKQFSYVAILYVVKFNSHIICVEVVRCVLRVEFCLDRAHKYLQDGVIRTLSPWGVIHTLRGGMRSSLLAHLYQLNAAIIRFLRSREDIPPAPICLYKAH